MDKSLRREFLANGCAGDDELLQEVESLLELDTRAGDFLEGRALDAVAEAFAKEAPHPAPSLARRMVSHYQILSKIGEGGMGVVYKARDTHLDRLVALRAPAPFRCRKPRPRRH